VSPPAPTDAAAAHRTGTLAGLGAYTIWGLFPLVFDRLRDVAPFEVLLHRIVWSFVVVVAVLSLRGPRSWVRTVLADRRQLGRLGLASLLISANWLIYIWAVANDHVVEAALGYYVNPLLTVALGVVVLGERLRRAQQLALGLGAVAVAVLTVAYGRLPWVALLLALSFAGYGFQKKGVTVGALPSLAVETALLVPFAAVALVILEARGTAAFLHGTAGRDALLVGLGVVTAVPLVLFATAASRIPLSLLGLLQYLTPTGQLLIGVAVLGEPLPPERLAGFVLVWAALVVLAADALRSARRRTTVTDALTVAEPT
jgi:chloramphenicol-sensitive protein RarD